ncbi:MAG: T9SS type A sorting domain-containing protein [Saprospiraceae bacterium]|nr:T9SS type A sorting domain-containing protein [Saprospiraceae bacterium]
MKLNFTLLYIVSILITNAHTQKHDFKWLLGQSFADNPYDTGWGSAIMDFNTLDGNPLFYEEKYKRIDFLASGANICDAEGNYLFACNGGYVEGPNDSLMLNGDDLGYDIKYPELGTAASQSVLILNKPNSKFEYILFNKVLHYIENYGLSINKLEYSIIDMNANSGNGKLTVRRKAFLSDTLDAASLIAARHANGVDWWLITSEDTKANYYVFYVSNIGVKLHNKYEFDYNKSEGESVQTCFANCGNYIATAAGVAVLIKYNLYFLKFDRCTGEILNFQKKLIPFHSITWDGGCCFSPDSKYLYYSTLDTLYQFPISSDTLGKRHIIGNYDSFREGISGNFFSLTEFGPMQLAPDGKIYGQETGLQCRSMHVIHNPVGAGDQCIFRQHDIYSPTIKMCLPNFPNYRLGPIDGSVCDSLGIDNVPWCHWRYHQDSLDFLNFIFTDLSAYEVEEWYWNFGDPASAENGSTQQHPVHRFSKPGIYEVCLIVKNKNGADTLCRTVRIAVVNNENTTEVAIQIQNWPNPFSHSFVLNVIGYNPQDMHLELVDLMGQVVHRQKLQQGSHWIHTKHLPPGTYSLQVFERNERVFGKQVLKF